MQTILKDKIVFVALAEDLGEKISQAFANFINMHFASLKELIEYDLFDSGQVLSQCGEEYYLMREKSVIKTACNYQDCIMFSNFDIFSHNKDTFDRCATKVFVKFPKKYLNDKDAISKLNFERREEFLIKNCDVTISVKTDNQKSAVKEICKILGGLA